MTLEDMIRRFRVLSNDREKPFLTSDEEVTDWLNEAQDQACVRGRLMREEVLPAMCRIALLPDQHTYKLHEAAYEIINLRILPANGGCSHPVTLKSREWLDNELPGWRDDTQPARFAIQDDTTIRLVGKITGGDVLALECYRLPIKRLRSEMDKPEIHVAHHPHLIQWALHRAFSVPDAETFDPNRAALAEQAFTRYFGPLPDSDMRRITRHDVTHHNATFLL